MNRSSFISSTTSSILNTAQNLHLFTRFSAHTFAPVQFAFSTHTCTCSHCFQHTHTYTCWHCFQHTHLHLFTLFSAQHTCTCSHCFQHTNLHLFTLLLAHTLAPVHTAFSTHTYTCSHCFQHTHSHLFTPFSAHTYLHLFTLFSAHTLAPVHTVLKLFKKIMACGFKCFIFVVSFCKCTLVSWSDLLCWTTWFSCCCSHFCVLNVTILYRYHYQFSLIWVTFFS